jgi:hypothetical protein
MSQRKVLLLQLTMLLFVVLHAVVVATAGLRHD